MLSLCILLFAVSSKSLNINVGTREMASRMQQHIVEQLRCCNWIGDCMFGEPPRAFVLSHSPLALQAGHTALWYATENNDAEMCNLLNLPAWKLTGKERKKWLAENGKKVSCFVDASSVVQTNWRVAAAINLYNELLGQEGI